MTMKALLITFDKYPDIDAGALRIHMFGKMLLEAGYEVHVISMGPSTRFQEIVEPDGIVHTSYRGTSEKKILKALYYLSFPNRLQDHLRQNDYNVIIHTQVDERSLYAIQAYGRKKSIPVLYDSVEWFSETQFSKGVKSRAYIKNNNYNTKLIKEPSSVIAISKYLEDHFKSNGIKTIRIPVVIDTNKTIVKKEYSSKHITLIYAGSPGKKDYLRNIIYAIDLLESDEKDKLRFVILGCTSEDLINLCGVKPDILERVKNVLEVKGRVPRNQVLSEYSKADFSVLIRPTDQRYAKAGFPTKFVESMTCNTPVICNLTSDLAVYAEDGLNSIVIQDIDPKSIVKALKRIIRLTKDQIKAMGDKARITAELCFDYRMYSRILLDFIELQYNKKD